MPETTVPLELRREILSNPNPELTAEFRRQLEAQWGDVDPFDGAHAGRDVPGPVIAIDDQDCFIGGLSFTTALRPGGDDVCVWINTVLVQPEFRGQCIALTLIEAGERAADNLGVSELFVLSEYPALYAKRDWVMLDTHEEASILTKLLT